MSIDDMKFAIEQCGNKRVLLIGDTIVDRYTYGKALGLSAETPTIVARKGETRETLGGAAFVCRNLLELGATVDFITLVGDDPESKIVSAFNAPKLNLVAIHDSNRRTTVKHRFWVDDYKLLQLDTRDDFPIEDPSSVLASISIVIRSADCVVVSDYRHGLLSTKLIQELIPILKSSSKKYYVDSQVSQNKSNHVEYQGGGVMCLNVKEARHVDPAFDPDAGLDAFAKLGQILATDAIIIKLGEKGAMMLEGSRLFRVAAEQVSVVDTAGAGDAFIAAFSLCGDAHPEIALKIANCWAGLSIGIRGTVPPRRADLWKMAGLA